MEMERINKDTIRVVIGPDDLDERGITFLDLLGNHKQIESFFYSILEEVDTEHQFENNESLTFQVLPNKDGLELYISKNPEESLKDVLDAAKKSEASKKELDDVSDFLKQKLTGTDSDEEAEDMDQDAADLSSYTTSAANPITKILKLKDFESLPLIATQLKLDGVESSLYKYDGSYYLELDFYGDQITPDNIKDELSVAYEYALDTKIGADVLSEHGKVIIESAALELARHYFV